ncbi:MAG: NAD(P)/FAD-dependent oxidoreductase [Desulfuromonadales bacterium]|nr:NAD(P)/FAD-dependent oxidoreductase [Desulfuromonadales bacterium]
MSSFKHDLVILGSGTTAFAAALRASELGAKTLMIEQGKLGGTCVNWGCVPSKTLIHKAALYYSARRGSEYGLNLSAATVDGPDLMNSKRYAVDQVRREHYQNVLETDPNIEVLYGHGKFVGPQILQVGPEVVHCQRVLIACGGVPRTLDLPGLAETGFLNSYSALNLPDVPKSLIILGGGVIALEMGQMFERFGCRTTILERGERLLAEFDPRLTAQLCGLIANEGLKQLFGVETERVEKAENGDVVVKAKVHGKDRSFQAERIMLAVGTAPATHGIGLEQAGVDVNEQGFVLVDDSMQTTVEGIWAAGDVTGAPLIAPAGELEAEVAVESMLLENSRQVAPPRLVDHRGTPMAVFVDPEIAMVGQNGEQATAAGHDVIETYLDLTAVAKAYVIGQSTGALLMWADRQSRCILGAQVLAPRAADLIHEMALAVRYGLKVDDVARMVHVYPTISDGWRLLARKCLTSLGCNESGCAL